MNNIVTAQELKTKGMSALNARAKEFTETFITIRGEKSFAVLTMDQYNYLRECELEAALKESEADLANGKFKVKTVAGHIKDLKNV
ncbi:type II toxin-antitoxin system Phd/YefM family antitoxin [Candidatus Peregrinibacteria bacterium]|nr:type II toxin-antitoxin system Phd/YefM family antitoxin [Candidatus Peregrinibacteria bacterium]